MGDADEGKWENVNLTVRNLTHRLKRIEERTPKPEEPLRFKILLVNPDGEIEEQILIENGTQRWVPGIEDV